MKIYLRHYFDASHQLPDTEHLLTKGCANLHGHTYAVKVWVEGDNKNSGMVVDFKMIKQTIDELDHQHLNNYMKIPTSENISIFLWDRLNGVLKPHGAKVTEIHLCEGYKGETKASWTIYDGT